jgi:hypothetical protein
MPKIQIGNENLNAAKKTVKHGFKVEEAILNDCRSLFEEFKIEGFQQLFDFLVVSGLIYFKREIIELIDENSGKLKERKKNVNGEGRKTTLLTFHMYPSDSAALDRFLIEKDIRKFWVTEILFKAFSEKNKSVIDHIKQCQELDVTNRKKQIVRLLNDEYIDVLPENDAEQLLVSFTEKYDKREFGENLQEEVLKFLSKRAVREEKEVEEKESFDDKMERIRQARKRLENIIEPHE